MCRLAHWPVSASEAVFGPALSWPVADAPAATVAATDADWQAMANISSMSPGRIWLAHGQVPKRLVANALKCFWPWEEG